MNEAVYEQATGLFVILTPVPFRAVGYAGRGAGRNNPAMDMMRNIGPLPAGRYSVSLPYSHPRKGPMCFRLTPDASNQMYGRSGFLIHGDNAQGDASEGCIVLGRHVRDLIARHNVRLLHVVDLAEVACTCPGCGVTRYDYDDFCREGHGAECNDGEARAA